MNVRQQLQEHIEQIDKSLRQLQHKIDTAHSAIEAKNCRINLTMMFDSKTKALSALASLGEVSPTGCKAPVEDPKFRIILGSGGIIEVSPSQLKQIVDEFSEYPEKSEQLIIKPVVRGKGILADIVNRNTKGFI